MILPVATVGGASQIGGAALPQKGDRLMLALEYGGGSGIDGARRWQSRADPVVRELLDGLNNSGCSLNWAAHSNV